jgi:WS/DGAT/MGAT family acyltransferase
MSPTRLSALDAAFLSLESEHAPMHVGWAARFDPPANGHAPRFEQIQAHIESRLGRAPRYRQRLAHIPLGLGDPVWIDDGSFDIDDHVMSAPDGGFEQLIDRVLSTPLRHGRPLWELWIAEDLPGSRIGVVGKAHHCLVDGLAAVELMALLLDSEPAPAVDEIEALDGWTARAAPSTLKLMRDAVGEQVDEALQVARLPLQLARNPSAVAGQAWRAARAVVQAAAPIAPRSHLNDAMTAMRHLATHSRPLEDLKVIKRRFGSTVNDVLLAACAGALRGLGDEAAVKAMVPVSVEAPGAGWGNRIAFLFLDLPCEEQDPVWRLRDVHVAMRERKRGGVPEGADTVLNALSYAPRSIRRVASKVIASPQLSNLTISNIPGPQFPVYLMGCEAREAYPVVPLTDRHGLSIGMTTIHERACFGVYAQAELAGEADAIAARIGDEIDLLLERAAP